MKATTGTTMLKEGFKEGVTDTGVRLSREEADNMAKSLETIAAKAAFTKKDRDELWHKADGYETCLQTIYNKTEILGSICEDLVNEFFLNAEIDPATPEGLKRMGYEFDRARVRFMNLWYTTHDIHDLLAEQNFNGW